MVFLDHGLDGLWVSFLPPSSPSLSMEFHPPPFILRYVFQGYPFSPLLFVIMAKGLGRSIKDALHSQQLCGVSFPNSPPLNHQQFLDDNMLYGHQWVQEAQKLKYLLDTFAAVFGASINQAKSQIFFFHTPIVTHASIARTLGFQKFVIPSNYLRAPLTDVALKHSSSNLLLEKLEERLSSWTHRSLNMRSHLVLIKPVLQPTLLYLF